MSILKKKLKKRFAKGRINKVIKRMEEELKSYVSKKIAAKYGLNERGLKMYLDKKNRGRPKKEKAIISQIKGDAIMARLISEARIEKDRAIEEEEEEIVVKRFNYHDKIYLRAQDNKIYSNETHIEIGIWNELKRMIEFD